MISRARYGLGPVVVSWQARGPDVRKPCIDVKQDGDEEKYRISLVQKYIMFVHIIKLSLGTKIDRKLASHTSLVTDYLLQPTCLWVMTRG